MYLNRFKYVYNISPLGEKMNNDSKACVYKGGPHRTIDPIIIGLSALGVPFKMTVLHYDLFSPIGEKL